MKPYWQDDHLTLYGGDCRAVLSELPAASIHCVVTSPPYWGLRDYGTATWDGGDAACDHAPRMGASPRSSIGGGEPVGSPRDRPVSECVCGARRIDSQLGLEPTPEEYVANMVAVFREVRRVLRDDGTLWLNLGDSYANDGKWGGSTGGKHVTALHGPGAEASLLPGTGGAMRGLGRGKRDTGLKPKDLVGIPWRVAFALQADGWYLRSDIIWAKPNPMPESVTDRPTKAHEYLFLLSKSPRYYFDADAVREGASTSEWPGIGPKHGTTDRHRSDYEPMAVNAGRNLRSVWTIATEPYPGAHFATFPRKLVEPCIKAGTSERGVCPECGAPWVRETVVTSNRAEAMKWDTPKRDEAFEQSRYTGGLRNTNGQTLKRTVETTGWRPSCTHTGDENDTGRDGTPNRPRSRGGATGTAREAEQGRPEDHRRGDPEDNPSYARTAADVSDVHFDVGNRTLEPVPALVLDPFAGSGTTLLVAQSLGRKGVGIDLNPEYLGQALTRNAQTPLGLVG